MRVSPVSASVAVTAAPTFSPAAVFSATERLTAVGLNTGALLVTAGVLLVTVWSVKVAVSLAAASTSLLALPVVGLV